MAWYSTTGLSDWRREKVSSWRTNASPSQARSAALPAGASGAFSRAGAQGSEC